MNSAALASMLVLGRLEDSPTGVCGTWLEAAERRCGRPAAADTWLCPRHISVARRRLEKAAQPRPTVPASGLHDPHQGAGPNSNGSSAVSSR